MYKLGLEKAEEPEIRLSTFLGTWRQQGSSRKTSTSTSLTMLKPLCRSQQTGEKFLRRWEYQTTLPLFWKTCKWVKKQQLELNMEQLTASKLEKESNKAVYVTLLV